MTTVHLKCDEIEISIKCIFNDFNSYLFLKNDSEYILRRLDDNDHIKTVLIFFLKEELYIKK